MSIAMGMRFSSSNEIVCCSREKCKGWILRMSNANKDYFIGDDEQLGMTTSYLDPIFRSLTPSECPTNDTLPFRS